MDPSRAAHQDLLGSWSSAWSQVPLKGAHQSPPLSLTIKEQNPEIFRERPLSKLPRRGCPFITPTLLFCGQMQTVTKQDRDPGKGSQEKSRKNNQVERKVETEKLIREIMVALF